MQKKDFFFSLLAEGDSKKTIAYFDIFFLQQDAQLTTTAIYFTSQMLIQV